jgi:serine/threonine-protein kinase
VNRETEITEATQMPTLGLPAGAMVLDRYRVEEEIGCGATSVVLAARSVSTDERVAIKIWRSDILIDETAVERFVREARAASALRSQHVARVRDAGLVPDGRPYIVMELLEGRDLGTLVAELGPLDPRRAVDFTIDACDAIAEAHSHGIVHRDIKPSNLFLARRADGGERLAVLDFGISKAPPGPEMLLTQTASLLGTPAYMSLEQMRSPKSVDARTDIWSLGAVLYELVEGRVPFAGNTFAHLCVSVATEPPRPMAAAPHLAPVIERCLAKRLEDRFQNIAEVAAELAPFASDPTIAAYRATTIARVLGVDVKAARGSAPRFEPRVQTDRGWTGPNANVARRDPSRPGPVPQAMAAAPAPASGPKWWVLVLAVLAIAAAVAAAIFFAVG